MSNPVRRLSITHPRLSNPVEVPLNWDSFPAPLQTELDALDANDDGTITYTAARGGGSSFEAQHADGTAGRLSRLLLSYAGNYPSNSRRADSATLEDRTRAVLTIQNRIYDNVVLPILASTTSIRESRPAVSGLGSATDRNDPARWVDAQRVLEESADFIHLYSVGQLAIARYEDTHNLEFLRIAEGCLLASRRYASMTRTGRTGTQLSVDRALRTINPILDAADQASFRRDIQSPYLMATLGSPITANLSTLQTENGVVYFGVAVPRAFVTANEADLNNAIVRYFNETSNVAIRASTFRDQGGTQEFRLIATRVERDAPGPTDDRIDLQSSFHIDQARLNRTVFQGQEMVYYRVGFRLPEATEVLGDRHIRKFDITLSHGEDVRRIEGGFVLQNMTDRLNRLSRASRDVFAGDLHVNERDYEVVRVMTDSLRSLAHRYETDTIQIEQIPILRDQADQVERFYESVSEQVTAAVANWNEAYRRGEIDRVFLDGDLCDFVNIAGTLTHLGYRSSNIRRMREILGRLEAPLYVVSGNHDHHGDAFPLSLHIRNFLNAENLRDLYQDHYDNHRFTGNLYFQGVKALIPDTSTEEGWVTDAFRELTAEDPFAPPNDAFLDHHLREIGIYETYGVGLGNGFRVFAWPTETEHFNYSRYLLEEVREPVGLNALRAVPQYVMSQHVNGKGPRPENFVAFLRELETARTNNQRLILMGHYPVFFQGDGPDQTPDTNDSLRGDAALAVRLASWYYRNSAGEAILAASIGAHVHHYEETDFILHFQDAAEKGRFREELGRIFAARNPATVFDQIHALRDTWDLDSRSEVRRVHEPGSDGYPGPILRSCNENSCSYYHTRGTAFLNLPSLGIPSNDQAGYVIITSHPNGQIDVSPRVIRLNPQGGLVDSPGSDLEAFRRRRWDEARTWDPNRSMSPFSARTNPTTVTISEARTPGERPRWDFLPIVYQYPENKLALTFDAGWGYDFRSGRNAFSLGGQLFIPLSGVPHRVFGGPNYLALGAEYSWFTNDLRARAGLDVGIVTPYLTVDALTRGNPVLGGELFFHSIFPHGGVTVFGGSTFQGDWNIGLGFRMTLPLVTYRISQSAHSDAF